MSLAQLGATVSLIGVVGDDGAADFILGRARSDGIDTTPVTRGASPPRAAALAVAASGATVARAGGRPDLAAGALAPHLAELNTRA